MKSTDLKIYNPLTANEIIRLEIELTSTCNLKCPLCIRSITDVPDENLYRPLEEIINQLDGYSNLQFVTIAGPISEPTSYPFLLELITYLNKRNIEISLFINGDTRTDTYYIKLGVLFRNQKGNVYFTICGSTQELHEKYRVNSNRDRVLKRLDIVNRYSGNRGILTWLVFNYNEADFLENYQRFKDKYRTEYFYTLPVAEHFQLNTKIRLPEKLSKIYQEDINRNDLKNIVCPANRNKFVLITFDGNTYPCSLYRLHGETHCFECSDKNQNLLRQNMIKNIAEVESEDSEIPMRLFYDHRNKEK